MKTDVSDMVYKIRYEEDADVLTLILKEKGKLSHAQEVGDIIVHFDEKGQPLFLEFLRDSKAGKIVPLLVEGLAKRELTVD